MREGWINCKLEEITTLVKRGISPKYVDENGVFVINQKCIRDNKVSYFDARLTSKEKKISEEKFVQVGDTLINSTGTGTLGRTGYVKNVPSPTTVDTHVTIVRPNLNKVEARFLGFFLNFIEPHIENLGKGATNQIELSAKDLSNTQINLPPLETQKKIASILSGYDDLIENNLKRIKILEEMAQQTYEEWFVRMRFPGHESATINHETGLPEGWEKVKCFDAMEVLSGGTPKTDIDEYWSGNIEFFTPKDAKSGSYTNGTEKHITDLGLKKCNSKLYPKDTVFITARGTVGKLNLAAEPMAMNQSCYALKGKGIISQYFLFCSMNSIIESFKSASNGGVFNTIVVDTFKFLDYIMPTEELIIQFEKIVTPIYKSILNLQNQNQRLREARDILLPRLMMGMIEV